MDSGYSYTERRAGCHDSWDGHAGLGKTTLAIVQLEGPLETGRARRRIEYVWQIRLVPRAYPFNFRTLETRGGEGLAGGGGTR